MKNSWHLVSLEFLCSLIIWNPAKHLNRFSKRSRFFLFVGKQFEVFYMFSILDDWLTHEFSRTETRQGGSLTQRSKKSTEICHKDSDRDREILENDVTSALQGLCFYDGAKLFSKDLSSKATPFEPWSAKRLHLERSLTRWQIRNTLQTTSMPRIVETANPERK